MSSIPDDPERQYLAEKAEAERAYGEAIAAAAQLPSPERQLAMAKAEQDLADAYRRAWGRAIGAYDDPNEAGTGPGGSVR